MNQKDFVFFDRKGTRWARLRTFTIAISIIIFCVLILFIKSLYITPRIHPPAAIADPETELKAYINNKEQIHTQPAPPKWLSDQPATQPSLEQTKPLESVRVGYYVDWDPNSLASLKKNISYLSHLAPEWYFMKDSSGKLHGQPNQEVIDLAKENGLKIIPIISNLENDKWHPEAVENLAFDSSGKRTHFINSTILQLKEINADGVILDWEELDSSYKNQMTILLKEYAEALHRENLELWLTIPVNSDMKIFDLDKLSSIVDRFIALLYDETGEDQPGPIASQQWFNDWINILLKHGESSKWVVALANLGYDWEEGKPAAESISFADAMSRAYHANHGPIDSGSPYYEPHFYYSENNISHTVWFLDAITFRNQKEKAESLGVGGIALMRLGTEDPQIWNLFNNQSQHHPTDFEKIGSAYTISHIGNGEVLTFNNETGLGQRKVIPDQSGSWTEQYTLYPQYPVIWHQGAKNSDEVAITFDDGPDPKWTPLILDILKEHNVKASFFLIGANAASYPKLVQRIAAEGHEIGNHSYTHPNLADVSEQRVILELNATQRVIEGTTGRSTILFRPPYDADTNPKSLSDCAPLLIAQSLGYINVMESVDSEDWQDDGLENIVKRVKERRREGNVLLFHDAGGNRQKTVEALPTVIQYLRNRGDQIVTLATLIGVNSNELMPPVSKDQPDSQQVLTQTGFTIVYFVEELVWAFMVVATILVILRTLIIVILALLHKKNENKRLSHTLNTSTEPVSVLIAAYNESKVIRSTLKSVLATTYKGQIEVIVIDDGSTDNTTEIVTAVAEQNRTIRLIKQFNTGKAEALKNGIENSSFDLIVMLDADTQFEPETIPKLVNALADPTVGAVSGHAKVGNQRRWLPRFQALEYTCGFNLDRRAYDVWNCITVAPGAVSAYRKSAIIAAGGIASNTLAEDTDLTLQLHRHGYKVSYTSKAVAWTEAPETFSALAKQRTRWAFGTIQCLWKHRDLLFNPKCPGLGFFSIPNLIFFQLFLVATIPLIDFLLLVSLITGSGSAIISYAVAFLFIDLILAGIACLMEKEPLKLSLYIIPMRLLYRPLLAYAIWVSIIRVMKGAWVGWGKLERKGTVRLRLIKRQVLEKQRRIA